jgi:hypothetical protein
MTPAAHSASASKDIRLGAVGLSLVLSLWHALVNPIPNPDGFEYVRVAEVFLEQGLGAAFALYPSATYPVLIGLLQGMGLGPFVAGQVLNAACYALLVNVFISLVLAIRDTRRLAILAALVVLVFPQLNEYRFYLIRDIACIALVLAGTLQLMRYAQAPAWREAVLFCGCLLSAALFRAEALVYLLCSPLVLLAGAGPGHFAGRPAPTEQTAPTATGAWLRLQGLVLGLGLAGVVALGLLGVDVPGTLQRIAAVYLPFVSAALPSSDAAVSPVAVAVFGEYAAEFSGEYLWLFMAGGMSALLLLKLAAGFGGPALLVLYYGWRTGSLPLRDRALRPLLFNALIAFGVLLGFLLLTRFLSTRYTLLFCVLLLPLLPLVLDAAIERLPTQPRARLLRGTALFLLLFCAVDAHISFGRSKHSLEQASAWLREQAAPGAVLLTNSNYVAYYSGMVADYDKVYRYVAPSLADTAAPGTLLAMSLDRGMRQWLEQRVNAGQLAQLAAFPQRDGAPDGQPDFAIYQRLAR